MAQTLPEFFLALTGREILPYQLRFGAEPFSSTLLIAPTGLGKTDAVLVPWLHAVCSGDTQVPTRLIFTLPRQNLTEQVARVAQERVEDAGLRERVSVHELMGGSSDNRRTVAPDQHAILVGTQDILISRALNRGYARRPFRWPIDFALLNNDCLWVLDEIQAMSDGLATSAQLAAFRDGFGVFGKVPCVWMSATADVNWLKTVDFQHLVPQLRTVGLNADDFDNAVVRNRVNANKGLAAAPVECQTPEGCAEFLLTQHREGERSLVIANTVARAREIAGALRKRTTAEVLLLHSRFRQVERQSQVAKLGEPTPTGQIIVSTQVIEAGIDLSANRLITDAAPWSSLVQRFGRVNRYGELETAQIWWVERPLSSKKPKKAEDAFAPYGREEVEEALGRMRTLRSASPADLPQAGGATPWNHVLRKADLIDLFDTSPDLSGNEIDVSRFIRSGEERNCYMAWREWEGRVPPETMSSVEDRELCAVPIGEARDFRKSHPVFIWDFLQRIWVEAKRWYPGMVVVVHCSAGGYTPEDGWLPGSKAAVVPAPEAPDEAEEGFGDDWRSWATYRQSLRDHTEMVMSAMAALLENLKPLGLEELRAELETAAAKHDWGKAHWIVQRCLHNADSWTEVLAKQERSRAARRYERPYFRHELASALAMIEAGDSDLAAYLAAAHHGRLRVGLRSMPGEGDGGQAVARGIRDGDRLPACELTDAVRTPEIALNLGVMRLGVEADASPSWTERVIRLRDRFGPFRLAFLEMLLRMADERASEEAGRTGACLR
jgi:CRISPR-associated endonuclease/helicase Cas3